MLMRALLLSLCLTGTCFAQATAPDPIHALIFGRPDADGAAYPNMVDPPLWRDTTYLLEGPSHARLVELLDALLAQNPEDISVRQRAMTQHALWQVFDWTLRNDQHQPEARVQLRLKLARAIRHIALTAEQIQALPASKLLKAGDADAKEALPPDVFAEGWVSVGSPGSGAVAEAHLRSFGGRSAFGVFMHQPGGAKAVEAYLHELRQAPFPPATQPAEFGLDAPLVPQFPEGTRLALVRRMMLIDRTGTIVASPILQSVQLRTFDRIEQRSTPDNTTVAEFTLDRAAYVAGDRPAWHRFAADEYEPPVFMTHDVDLYARPNEPREPRHRPAILRSCFTCHSAPGAQSMLSHTRLFTARPVGGPRLEPLSIEREEAITRSWKEQHASWGVLRGIWEAGR